MMHKQRPQSKVEELKEALKKRRQMEQKEKTKQEQQKEGVKQADDASAVKQEKALDQASASVDLDEFAKHLAAAEEEARAHYDKLLRVMAELDNYKKRTEREKQEMIKYSNEQIISDLLPVLDDMDRVLDHVPPDASKELMDFVSGVSLLAKQFVTILNKYGLEEIKTDGEKFNPEMHEAVAHLPSDDVAPDYILETHRKGYLLNGRIIRAAMVSVSKGKCN